MDEKKTIIKDIIGVLGMLQTLTGGEKQLRQLVLTTGWDVDELAGFNISDVSDTLAPLTTDLQDLLNYVENPPASFKEVLESLDKAKTAFARLTELKQALENVDLDAPDKDKLLDFTKDLLNILL